MSENKIPLPGEQDAKPQAPDFLKADEWFDIDISGDLLDFAEPYRPPRYTMERDGVPFADVGELHIISGKPGHGKTGLMSQLMATCLCGQHGNTRRRDVYHLVRQPDGLQTEEMVDVRVLYIDTEQGKDDTIAIKNRVCSMAGIDYTKPTQQFTILRLRDTELAQDRWRKILKAIHTVRPTDIFLDGTFGALRQVGNRVVPANGFVFNIAQAHFENGSQSRCVGNADALPFGSVGSKRSRIGQARFADNVEADTNERIVRQGTDAKRDVTANAVAVVNHRQEGPFVIGSTDCNVPCKLGETAVLVIVIIEPITGSLSFVVKASVNLFGIAFPQCESKRSRRSHRDCSSS